MDNIIYIYGLFSEDKHIRYVGKTVNLNKRLKQHIANSKNKKTHRDQWIQKCLSENKEINIKLIETCDESNWQDREKYWIKFYRENSDLTNHYDGGESGSVIKYTESYEMVREWVQKNIKSKSKSSWYKNIKENTLPKYIPLNPREVYLKRGWVSWGDFLGTNNKYDNDVNYISYMDAKKYIKDNLSNIKTQKKWKISIKEGEIPKFIPNRPERYYNNKNRGWISWGDFLGTNRVANQNKNFLKYNDCREYVVKLKIKSIYEWRKYCKSGLKPDNIPSCPDKNYKNCGWIDFGEFLGTGKISDNKKHENYLKYEEAKEYLKLNNIKIKNYIKWREFIKSNTNLCFLPLHPEQSYRTKGWINWDDFLGKNKGK